MLTGQNAPQEIVEFVSGHVPFHSEPTQPQNKIYRLSRAAILPILETTHKRASNIYNTSINRLVEAIAGIASTINVQYLHNQNQHPQTHLNLMGRMRNSN